jgi:hypothetical protein
MNTEILNSIGVALLAAAIFSALTAKHFLTAKARENGDAFNKIAIPSSVHLTPFGRALIVVSKVFLFLLCLCVLLIILSLSG